MIKINFFERRLNNDTISIEKLFDVIKQNLVMKGYFVNSVKNPYPLYKMIQSMLFFRKNQGSINHITGDIHWASLLLNTNTTILTIHDLVGLNRLNGIKKKIFFLLWYYLPIKKMKYITTISEKIKNDIVKLIPSAEKKIRVVNNCLTIELAPKKHKHKIDKVLVVGTRENKNIERILESLHNVNISLTIVGPLTALHLELIKKYRLCVTNLLDLSDDEIIDMYDSNDILCFPSLYEGFGLPILEAQARSCVVITSKLEPMMQIGGGGALFVNPIAVNEIREAVVKLMNDLNLANQLIDDGHENVKKYAPNVITDCYIDIYKEILKDGTN